MLRVFGIKRLIVSDGAVRVAIPAWAGDWLFSQSVQTGSGAHPASLPGIERPGREVHHSSPSNAKVKREWINSSVPPLCLYGLDVNSFDFYMFHSLVRK